jgi:hypothetical protein
MSTPLDRDLSPLYAAKWMRDERRVQECVEEIQALIQKLDFHPPPPVGPPSAEEGGVPHWFAPNLMPEAAPVPRRSKVGMIVCFFLAIAVPAIAAPFVASKSPSAETMTTVAERSNEPSAQLSATQGSLRNQGEVCPLAVTVVGSVVGASVVINGLASGSTLTVGLPLGTNGWQLAAADLDKALVRPPQAFIGPMDVVLELRLADNTLLDRKPLRLEWVAAAGKQSTGYPLRQLSGQELAGLIKRGERFIATGDLASARLVLQRAAEAGDHRAALMLAGTYDPIVLEKIGIQGFAPDIIRGFAPNIASARTWYELAKQFGSTEAVRRLEMLASSRGF